MPTPTRFPVTPLAAAIALALAGPARAQSADAPAQEKEAPRAKMDTVVVTAQGRRENPLKVPYNLSAVSGDDLQDRRITDQSELLREIPGASVVDRGQRNTGVFNGVTIRGLNTNGAAFGDYQTSTVPSVSTYVDQVPIYANFLIKDLERVEVLRGPQGTLYGSGSLGGTVRYITRAPDLKRFSGRVETSASRTDGSSGTNLSGDVMLNVPFSDMLAARLVLGRVDNAGVIDYVNVYQLDAKGVPVAPKGLLDKTAAYEVKKDADTVKIDHARLSVLLKPSSGFSMTLTHQYQKDDVGGRRQPTRGNNGAGLPYGKYENGSVQLEPAHRTAELTSLEAQVDLGFATLTGAASHYDQHGDSLSENTGFYAKNNWLKDFYYNYPRPMAQARRDYADKATVGEVRLISKKSDTLDYIVGLYRMDQDLWATQYSYLRGLKAWADVAVPGNYLLNDNDFLFERTQKYRETSAYGELVWHVLPTLRATVGLRHFNASFRNDTLMGVPIWGLTPEHSDSAQKDSGTLHKVNLAYDLAPGHLLYATVSQGYRRGGANAVPLTGNFAESPAYLTYGSDTSTNREIGVKGAQGSIRYSASVFDIRWKDVQVETSTPNWGFFAAQNGGRASSKGLELEASALLTEDLRVGLGFTHVDAKFTDPVLRVDKPSVVLAPAGTPLPAVAKNTISANVEHTMGLSNGWLWTNRLSAFHQGSTENAISTSPRFKQTWPGFSIVNASSTLAGEQWSLTLFVKNLTNSAGITGGFLEGYMGTDPSQNYFGNGSKVFISQPRTVGLSLAYGF